MTGIDPTGEDLLLMKQKDQFLAKEHPEQLNKLRGSTYVFAIPGDTEDQQRRESIKIA
jgi:hypothetical protein